MTNGEYTALTGQPLVDQQRPIWLYEDEFTEKGKEFPVTFLICQKNTKTLIQLAIESILRFYPDVNILVVDDDSDDDSILYLQYKELVTPNLKVWKRNEPYIGHGGLLDLAIRTHIETEYVMIMDSDVVIQRGNFIEPMLKEFETNKKLYAIGSLQISSYKNNGGEPMELEDITPYGNPQLCLYHVATYLELPPAINDGTPLILNNKGARDAGLEIKYFPTDKYSNHNSGSSWVKPQTIWIDDHDIKLRPFLTIIGDLQSINLDQTDTDFDIVLIHSRTEKEVIFTDGSPAKKIDNYFYSIRFNIHGEYVVNCADDESISLQDDFVAQLKKKVIEEKAPDIVEVYGMKCYRRRYFQKVNCLA